MLHRIKRAILILILGIIIFPFQKGVVKAADSIIIDHDSIDTTDSLIPQAYLDIARTYDVLFGHQSVGNNILDGMSDLETSFPARYSFNRQSSDDTPTLIAWFGANDGIGDFLAGSNGDPDSKVDEFDLKLNGGLGAVVDIAFFKFCYVDNTDTAENIWSYYRTHMETLESAYPGVIFIWWTMPLQTTGNSVRDEYNTLVRNYINTHSDKYLFDIADIESHTPDGAPVTQGGFEALYSGYTTDGGHLNDASNVGRGRVARALWWLLARIAGWTPDFHSRFAASSQKWNDWFSPNSEIPDVGYFNNDSYSDIITFVSDEGGDVWVALNNNGASFSNASKWHDYFAPNDEIPVVGDFNGDGFDDIATFTSDALGDVWVALNNGGSGFNPASKWHDYFAPNDEIPRIGDFNNDGYGDIVTFVNNALGDVWVALNNSGTSFSSASKWHDWFSPYDEIPSVGKFNSDDYDDIATFVSDAGGDVWVSFAE